MHIRPIRSDRLLTQGEVVERSERGREGGSRAQRKTDAQPIIRSDFDEPLAVIAFNEGHRLGL